MSFSGYRLELNPIESFSFFCKTIWDGELSKRFHAQIPDTIVYYRGRPHSWYFTSQKTGEVLRKKAEKLNSVRHIVEHFKQKSRTFPGHRPSSMRQKIAIVWYMRSETELTSFIVDDQELGSLLSSSLKEVLAVQVYYGGNCARGNGVFEHKLTLQKNGVLKHVTYEYIDESYEFNLAQFSTQGRKLTVIDHMQDVLTQYSQSICRNIESQFVCKVAGLSFTVVFSNSWVPVLVSMRDIVLENVSTTFFNNRETLIYFESEAPKLPPINEMSVLLPMHDPALSARMKVDSHGLVESKGILHRHSNNQARHPIHDEIDDAENHSQRSEHSQNSQQSLTTKRRTSSENSSPFHGSFHNRPSTLGREKSSNQNYDNGSNKARDQLNGHLLASMKSKSDRTLAIPKGSDSSVVALNSTEKLKKPKVLQSLTIATHSDDSHNDDLVFTYPDIDNERDVMDDENSEERLLRQSQRKKRTKIPDSVEIALGFRQSLRRSQTLDSLVTNPLRTSSLWQPVPEPQASPHSTQPLATAMSPSSVRRLHMPTNASHQIARIGLQKRIHHHFVNEDIRSSSQPAVGFDINMGANQVDLAESGIPLPRSNSAGYLLPCSRPSSPGRYSETHHTSNSYSLNHLVGHQASTGIGSGAAISDAGSRASSPTHRPSSAAGRSSLSGGAVTTTPGNHSIHIPKNLEEMNDGSRRDLSQFLITRRPISAPHNSEHNMQGRRSRSKLRDSPITTVSTPGSNLYPVSPTSPKQQRPASATRPSTQSSSNHKATTPGPVPLAATISRTGVAAAGDEAATSFRLDSEAAKRPETAFLWREMLRHPESSSNSIGGTPSPKDFPGSDPPASHQAQTHNIPVHQRGLRCFGDFCHFQANVRQLIDRELTADAARHNATALSSLSKGEKSRVLEHKLTLKSIFLARTEMSFVSVPLDSPVESMVVRSRLQPLDDDALCMYFVRRHINRIVQKCQEESRLLLFGHRTSNATNLLCADDTKLSGLYRRLVYGAALAHIHPSRFYYAVQLCRSCYKMYSFLDAQRDTVLLHIPSDESTGANPHHNGASTVLWEKSAASNSNSSGDGHLFGGASVVYRQEDELWRKSLEKPVGNRRPRTGSTESGGVTSMRRPLSAPSVKRERVVATNSRTAASAGVGAAGPNADSDEEDVFIPTEDGIRSVHQFQSRAMIPVERVDSSDYYRYQHSSFSARRPSVSNQPHQPLHQQQHQEQPSSGEHSQQHSERRKIHRGEQTCRGSITADPQLAIQIAESAKVFANNSSARMSASHTASQASETIAAAAAASSSQVNQAPGIAETKRLLQQINSQQQQLLASAQAMDYQKLYVQHHQLSTQQQVPPRPRSASASLPVRRTSSLHSTGGTTPKSRQPSLLAAPEGAMNGAASETRVPPLQRSHSASSSRDWPESGLHSINFLLSNLQSGDLSDVMPHAASEDVFVRVPSGLVPDIVAAGAAFYASAQQQHQQHQQQTQQHPEAVLNYPFSFPASLAASGSGVNSPSYPSGILSPKQSTNPKKGSLPQTQRTREGNSKSVGDLRLLAVQNSAQQLQHPPTQEAWVRQMQQQQHQMQMQIEYQAQLIAQQQLQLRKQQQQQTQQQQSLTQVADARIARQEPYIEPSSSYNVQSVTTDGDRDMSANPSTDDVPYLQERSYVSADAEATDSAQRSTKQATHPSKMSSRIQAAQDAQREDIAEESIDRNATPSTSSSKITKEAEARQYSAQLHQKMASHYEEQSDISKTTSNDTSSRPVPPNKSDKSSLATSAAYGGVYAYALDALPFGSDTPLYSLAGDVFTARSTGSNGNSHDNAATMRAGSLASAKPSTTATVVAATVELSAVLEGDAEDDERSSHVSSPVSAISGRPSPAKSSPPFKSGQPHRSAESGVGSGEAGHLELQRGDSIQSVSTQLSNAPTVIVHPLTPPNHPHHHHHPQQQLAHSPDSDRKHMPPLSPLISINVPTEREVDPLTEDDDMAGMFVLSTTPNPASNFPLDSEDMWFLSPV